jgi:outer membrane receptor protein involved in Fe transport
LPDTQGSFNVKEAYAEINVPILADVPFFHQLNLRAAGRASDYSTVGNVYSYSGGVEWSPIPDIRFSATYARSVRAPNIGELFHGTVADLPERAGPLRRRHGDDARTLGTQCRASPGVLANIAANNGVFTLTQSDRQSVSGFNSGNPNLNEEKSDSYTASVTINPRSIEFCVIRSPRRLLQHQDRRRDQRSATCVHPDPVLRPGRPHLLRVSFNVGPRQLRRTAPGRLNS